MINTRPETVPQQQRQGYASYLVTNSFWRALKHLHIHAGCWFWFWSGLIFFGYRMTAERVVPYLLYILGGNPLGENLGFMLPGIIFNNWQLAWVHFVISCPSSPMFFFKRLLQLPCCPEDLFILFLERIFSSMAFNTALDLQTSLLSTGITGPGNNGMPGSLYQQGYWNCVICLLPRIVELVVSIPLRIIFIRMAASRLTVDDQSIICLDRSVRGSSSLGIVDAWETFDKPARARVWKIYTRLFATSMAICLLGEMLFPGFHKQISYPLIWFRP